MYLLPLVFSALLTFLWLASLLSSVCPVSSSCASVDIANEFDLGLPTSLSWSNTITFDVRIAASNIYQQVGALLWFNDAGKSFNFPFTILADGAFHTVTLPVGAHPDWRGTVERAQIIFPYQDTNNVEIDNLRLIIRPWWAYDQLLLTALFPVLPAIPPWSAVLLLTGILLGSGVVVTLPWSSLRTRCTVAGIVFAVGLGLWTVVTQIVVVNAVASTYLRANDIAAAASVPLYDTKHQASAQLAAAARQLSDGPILLLDVRPHSDVLHYAQYLFYPHRVDSRSPQDRPADIPDLLTQQYSAVIQAQPNGQAPLDAWPQLSLPEGPLAIWHKPQAAQLAVVKLLLPTVLPGLITGLLAVGFVGWSIGGVLRTSGVLRIVVAWPLGTITIAWWMWLLDVSGISWNWATIALPLVSIAVIAAWSRWRQRGWASIQAALPKADWTLAGWVVVAFLFGCVCLQATLMPSIDRDTWTMWGLKAKAFYLDDAIAPVLTMYRQFEPHHSGYPPGQPLLVAWVYTSIGGISERLGKSIFPLWYLTCIGLIWVACRQWMASHWAMAWTLLVATTPIVLDHATINNADLPLATVLLLGGVGLIGWIETTQRSQLVLATLALAGAAWLKPDGIFLGLGVLCAALLVRLWVARSQHQPAFPLLRDGTLALMSLLALFAPWWLHAWSLQLNSDAIRNATALPDVGTRLWDGIIVIIAEMAFSSSNSAQGLLGGSYGVLWFICLGTLVMNWQRLKSDPVAWFLLLVFAGGVFFYLAVYVVRPYYSIDRYLLHLAPFVVLAAARSTLPAPEPIATITPPLRGRNTAQHWRKGRSTV